ENMTSGPQITSNGKKVASWMTGLPALNSGSAALYQPSRASFSNICTDSGTAKFNLCSLEPKARFDHFSGVVN
ncbi:hypothetical protein, partial [Pseudomonas viridiflava]|uniref:hypothetical protein n=1 Tax=Pseudomonas viridiflava TaxID=33069 RepID=UPI00197E3106